MAGNSSGVFLDDAFTFNPLTAVSDNGYFANIYPVDFNSGDRLTSLLFTVTLPSNLTPATYAGTFSLLEDGNPAVTNTQNFQITIPGTSPVPEPSS